MSILRTDTPAYRGTRCSHAPPPRTWRDWLASLFRVETPRYRTRRSSPTSGSEASSSDDPVTQEPESCE